MSEREAIVAHHAGDHIPQPCCVQFADGSWSPCDVQALTVSGVTIVGTIYVAPQAEALIENVTVLNAMRERRPRWMPRAVQRRLLRLVTVPAAMPTDAAIMITP